MLELSEAFLFCCACLAAFQVIPLRSIRLSSLLESMTIESQSHPPIANTSKFSLCVSGIPTFAGCLLVLCMLSIRSFLCSILHCCRFFLVLLLRMVSCPCLQEKAGTTSIYRKSLFPCLHNREIFCWSRRGIALSCLPKFCTQVLKTSRWFPRASSLFSERRLAVGIRNFLYALFSFQQRRLFLDFRSHINIPTSWCDEVFQRNATLSVARTFRQQCRCFCVA